MAQPGADQLPPLERLVRLLAVLWSAGGRGVPVATLLRVAEFGGDPSSRSRQLQRTLRHLDELGWDIRNTADEGLPAVYRLVARDNRLRVELTTAQQAALRRAALVAGRADLGERISGERISTAPTSTDPTSTDPTSTDPTDGEPVGDRPAAGEPAGAGRPARRDGPPGAVAVAPRARPRELERVLHAASQHCLLRFTYKGRPRTVHPHAVWHGATDWYLAGREDSAGPRPSPGALPVKTYVVDRMSDVRPAAPGTATPPASPHRAALDPLAWDVDPRVDVRLRTSPEHLPQVRALLGREARLDATGDVGLELTFPVTHRAAFRSRLYELGRRVEILGPPDVRSEVLAHLRRAASGGGP